MTTTSVYSLPTKQGEIRTLDMEEDLSFLRSQGPLVRVTFPFGGDGWVVTTYEESRALLADPRLSLAEAARGQYPHLRAGENRPEFYSFMQMDPPEHGKHRSVLGRHMTVKRVNELRVHAQAIVDEILDRVEASPQPVDLVAELSSSLPIRLLCKMLGVPENEQDTFVQPALDFTGGMLTSAEEVDAALGQMRDYFLGLVDLRREYPGDDIFSALVRDATAEGWSEHELYGTGVILLLAGHDAPAGMLGAILHILANDPQLYARLRADPAAVRPAIEEFLRFIPNGVSGVRARIALERIEIGGVVIEPGDAVLPLMHSANFDEAAFACPHLLDVERKQPKPHMTFGFGPHGCMGNQVARMELDVALTSVLARFSRLEAVPTEHDWREDMMLRGPVSVLCTFDIASEE